VQVRVLGELEIVLGGDPVDLGGPKPRALLALLVAAEGRPVQVEHLIGQIWGEQPPARVDASLQSYVARLRRALEPDRDAGRVAQRLRTHTGGYSLDVDAEAVDARRFVSLVRRARTAAATAARTRTGADEAIELLSEALELWCGPAYTGLPSPALEAEATRLEELRMSALVELWQLRLARGDHGDAVAELEQLTRLHPLREQLWALLALALYRSSRQADALAALRRVREDLADELGVDPGPELRRLEQAILNHDPALDPPPSGSSASRASARRHEPPAGPEPEPEREREPEPHAPGRELFGRTAALAEAAGALAACASGRGRTILVTGEPGIGKTRFTEALVAHAASTGYRVGRGGWEPEACPPLWGWTRALTQLLGHAEPLLSRPDDVTDAASASFRQADAMLAALRDGPPALIVLDDVHWADVESLRLLRRVAAELPPVRAVLVVALRSAPADIGDAVADALATLARLDPLRVELGGLDAEAVAAWVAERAGVERTA
jgi:DNA-binding SARP family transcriptional activator